MSTLEEMLEQAENLYFEERDYRAAHDLLWSSAMETVPNMRAVLLQAFSLRHIEYEELLAILRKYRDVTEVQMGIAEAFVDRHEREAALWCTNLLDMNDLTPKEVIDIRWARIRAVARYYPQAPPEWYESLGEDFCALWRAGYVKAGISVPYSRRWLLATIAQIKAPSAVAALRKLADEELWLPDDIRKFIEHKGAELKVLGELLPQYDNPSTDIVP